MQSSGDTKKRRRGPICATLYNCVPVGIQLQVFFPLFASNRLSMRTVTDRGRNGTQLRAINPLRSFAKAVALSDLATMHKPRRSTTSTQSQRSTSSTSSLESTRRQSTQKSRIRLETWRTFGSDHPSHFRQT
jgi:hypothetical protein